MNVPAVNKQIQNVFEGEELQEDSVISILEITAADGKLSDIPSAKYGVKPIFVSFGADYARTIIDNMALDDWAPFCEVKTKKPLHQIW